jgi:hypothetical protein
MLHAIIKKHLDTGLDSQELKAFLRGLALCLVLVEATSIEKHISNSFSRKGDS